MYQPVGPVQHSGTFNAHIVPVLAGLAFMKESAKPYFYPQLGKLGTQLDNGIASIIRDNDLNMIVPFHGARFNIILGRKTPALCYEDTFCHDSNLMLRIYRGCWERGMYFHDYGGGPLHHGFSIQHTEEDIDKVLSVLGDVLVKTR